IGDDVDAGVKAEAARAEWARDRALQRPGERDRTLWRRSSERGEGRRAGPSVRSQARPALKAAQRALDATAEHAVERPRRKAVPGQLELERGDVPAEVPARKNAAPDPVATEPAQSAPRARARNSV